jgi:peptidoglycan/xylan/chitin deacetylase (PgdA/CDA1 family)
MRGKLAIAAIATIAVGAGVWAIMPDPTVEAASVKCLPTPAVLGVSRTVTIDATGGPRFGQQQYGNPDFLADGEVVLTFDDGPLRPHTARVVKALERHCTKATFFIVGRMALSDPAMVKEIAGKGHTIGTHTWSHQYQLRKTNIARAQQEIELGFSAVQKALGAPVAPFFRFPFLSDSRAALQHLSDRNIGAFSIDVDAVDYKAKGPDGAQQVFDTVMGELAHRKKGILLFHDIQPSTAEALPRILDALKAKGFRVVHMAPKQQATTLAEYDRMVDSDDARRKLIAANQPLAPRAVTWPIAGLRPWATIVTPNEQPPPVVTGVQRPLAPPTVQPPPRRSSTDQMDDWRRRVFGF